MQRALHFITGDFEKKRVFLPDKEYGLALDTLVKGCADVLVTRSSPRLSILLGRRCVHPQPDWWFVGGRTRPGDTPQEGAARNVKRELGLDLPPDRYRVVGVYSFVWRTRQQAPATNGTADMSTVLQLRLSDAEASSVSVDSFAKSEYRDAKWIEPKDILRGDFNPALQQAVRDLLTMHAFNDLSDAVNYGRPAYLVAAHARRLLAWHSSAPTLQPLKVIYDEDAQVYNFVDPVTQDPMPRPTKALPPDVDTNRLTFDLRLLADAVTGPLIGATLTLALLQLRRFI